MVDEDLSRNAVVHRHQAKKDVLGADVVVPQVVGAAKRALQHLLRQRRKRDVAPFRWPITAPYPTLDLAHYGVASD